MNLTTRVERISSKLHSWTTVDLGCQKMGKCNNIPTVTPQKREYKYAKVKAVRDGDRNYRKFFFFAI